MHVLRKQDGSSLFRADLHKYITFKFGVQTANWYETDVQKRFSYEEYGVKACELSDYPSLPD